jgi:hypothetical protein
MKWLLPLLSLTAGTWAALETRADLNQQATAFLEAQR